MLFASLCMIADLFTKTYDLGTVQNGEALYSIFTSHVRLVHGVNAYFRLPTPYNG